MHEFMIYGTIHVIYGASAKSFTDIEIYWYGQHRCIHPATPQQPLLCSPQLGEVQREQHQLGHNVLGVNVIPQV